jgi:MFS-type transporter involved in bile tolerance (Atg22 family)
MLSLLALAAAGSGCFNVRLLVEANDVQEKINRNFKSAVRPLTSPPDMWSRRGGVLTRDKQVTTREPLPPVPPPPDGKAAEEPKIEANEEQTPKDDPRILMLIRLLFITYYGSLGSLLPYLPVYYHSLGHGGQIIGMLGAIKPFTTFLVAPFWGMVSDQTGSPFTVLYFTFLISIVGQLLIAWKHDPVYIMVMVFITAFFNAPVKSLLDSMVMSHLHDRSRYGRLRLWGQLGFGIGSSGVGVLLSKSKHRAYNPTAGQTLLEKLDNFWQSITGYKLLFLTYFLMSLPTFICIRAFHKLHDEKEKEKERVLAEKNSEPSKQKESLGFWDGINVLFHNSDALLFFFLVFVVGISSGIIENFAYVRIREVGGNGKDMGLSRLVSSMAGAPMFWFSGPLTELLGADKVIVLSLCSYVVRFVIYASMRSPLQGLPAEAMRGVTFAAFWSTCTIYASRIAPPGMGATMVRE